MTRDLTIHSYVQGALQAFMLVEPNEIEKTLFEKSVRLAVKEHWNQPIYRQSLIDFLKKFDISFICFKCGGDIEQGQALENTWIGFDDFGNDAGQPGTTMSKIGHPNMINCHKCKSCGHSFTI